jgi:acyl carrier protein
MAIDREPIVAYLAEKIGGDRSLLPKGADSLVDEGILDSFGLADLVAMIEKAYGVKVPDKDLALANFDTVDKIASYVEKRK